MMRAVPPGEVDPNTPLCTTPEQLASWAVPGAIGDPSCHPDPTVAEMVGAPDFPAALGIIVKSLATFWVGVPSPILADSASATGVTAWLTHSLAFYTACVMILSIVIQAARIGWRGRSDGLQELVQSVVRYVLVSSIGAIAVTMTLAATDAASAWLIEKASGGTDFGTNLANLLGGPAIWASLGAVLTTILLGLAVVVSAIQVGIMLVRGGVLILLVGTWPLSASAAAMEAGKTWYTGHTAWIIAFVFYKFAASMVYAVGFALMGTPSGSPDAVLSVLTGVAFIVAAIFTLGALIKLAMPNTAPVAGGKGMGSTVAGGASLLIATRR